MKPIQCFILTLFTLVMLVFVPIITTAQSVKIPEPVYPPAAVREAFDLDPFYEQWVDVEGLPVVASAKVNSYAVKEAAWLIRQIVGHRQDVMQALTKNNVRFVVMAHNELTTQIPEHSDLRPDFYWDRRTRGLGPTAARPATSCGEENLLNYTGDPYWNENILIHEFSHAIHLMGLNTVDPDFDDRLKRTYNAGKEKGLWKDTYAITNKEEYWAEGTQSWFDTNRANDSIHNHVDTRDKLKEYDPSLAVLLAEVYGDTDWRYTQAVTRTHLSHLQGFNPEVSPKFKWPPELIELTELYQQLKDPNNDGGGKWVNLKEHAPNLVPHLIRSAGDATETTIIFVNGTNAEIAYYWVDRKGNEKFYGWIAPDTFITQDTYTGHIWLIKDLNGGDIVVFRAEKTTGRALVISGDVVPVTLSHFRAELTDVGVVIKWTTESEVDNAGFYIYRSETRDGEFKVVNPSMIQGAGTTAERSEYTWTDTTAKPNTVYYYRIEDVSHAGERKQLATVRLRGLVSASGKLTTRWAGLKMRN